MIFGHIDNQIVSQVQGCKWVSLIELGPARTRLKLNSHD